MRLTRPTSPTQAIYNDTSSHPHDIEMPSLWSGERATESVDWSTVDVTGLGQDSPATASIPSNSARSTWMNGRFFLPVHSYRVSWLSSEIRLYRPLDSQRNIIFFPSRIVPSFELSFQFLHTICDSGIAFYRALDQNFYSSLISLAFKDTLLIWSWNPKNKLNRLLMKYRQQYQ